jgi:hypothetical protein
MNMFTRKGQDLLGLVSLMAILALSSTLAMLRIDVSQKSIDPLLNPSPLGYTFSLALFVVPCVVLGIWVWRSKYTPEQRVASGITLVLLIPIGVLLDLIFGRTFLLFPNPKATLGILVPGYDLRSGWAGLLGPGWKPFLPLEEFAFYALGFVAILLTYIWGDEILFRANKVDDRQRTPRAFRGWKERSFFWLGSGAALFAIAWAVRRHTPSQSGHAFPGYFLFLLVGSIVPSLLFSRVAFQFINWRALSLSWLFILTLSQFWEASLGIPYGWWAYQPDQMMGVFLKAHCNLPLEAVLVWTLGSWTTAIIYETVLTALHAGRKGRHLFTVLNADEEELQRVKKHHLQEGRLRTGRW